MRQDWAVFFGAPVTLYTLILLLPYKT